MTRPRNPPRLFIDVLLRVTLATAIMVMIPIGIVLMIGFSIADGAARVTATLKKPARGQ